MASPSLAPTQGGENKRERPHWELSEDIKLTDFVARHGARDWKLISEQLHGRSGKSCRLRWLDHLDPKVKKTAFTEEENEILIRAHETFGNKWSQIATFLPGRTDNRSKNQWHVLTALRTKNVNAVSTSCAYNRHVSVDNANINSARTITLLGKSIAIAEDNSFSCINKPASPSVVKVANGGGYEAGTGTLVPSAVVDPLAQTKFIDFLGVGDQ